MASGRRYKVPFRRRREGKTDYNLRRKLVLSDKTRVVIRRSNSQTTVQLVKSEPKGDQTLCQVTTKNIQDLGWKANTNNIPAAYLTGYTFGKKVLAKKILSDDDDLIMDMGLATKFYGGRTFATLKGALDAGLEISHGDDKIFPSEERIRGEHISKFGEVRKENDIKDERFSKSGIDPSKIPAHFDEIKSKIDKTKTF